MFGAKKEIGPDTVLQRRNDILFNEVDGEVVILSIENSQYFGLDKVGSKIWQLIEKPLSINQLVTLLKEKYDVSLDQCMNETLVFLSELDAKKLLKLYN